MDCKQSEIAMMQHMEKTITPADAKKLAEHVLICETCREYYLAFDEMMESITEDFEIVSPPEGFTSAVMAKVYEIEETAEKPAVVRIFDGQFFMKVFWTISAVLMGVGSYFIFNPDVLSEISAVYPAVEGFVYALSMFGQQVGQGVQGLVQIDIGTGSSLSVVALFFALMLGGLLTVLHREESGIKA